MNIKQKMRNYVLGAFLLITSVLPFTFAADRVFAAECGGQQTAIINCSQNKDDPKNVQETGLWGVLILTINILTAGVGVLAVAGFIYGGILYITSAGSPEQVKKARTVFTNVIIGVVAFGGMFALLNFLIPGGVFN